MRGLKLKRKGEKIQKRILGLVKNNQLKKKMKGFMRIAQIYRSCYFICIQIIDLGINTIKEDRKIKMPIEKSLIFGASILKLQFINPIESYL
jgi:hypothetical protein